MNLKIKLLLILVSKSQTNQFNRGTKHKIFKIEGIKLYIFSSKNKCIKSAFIIYQEFSH